MKDLKIKVTAKKSDLAKAYNDLVKSGADIDFIINNSEEIEKMLMDDINSLINQEISNQLDEIEKSNK